MLLEKIIGIVQRVKNKNHFFEGTQVQSLNLTFKWFVLQVTALETSPQNVSDLHYLQIYLLFLFNEVFNLLKGDLAKRTSLQRFLVVGIS